MVKSFVVLFLIFWSFFIFRFVCNFLCSFLYDMRYDDNGNKFISISYLFYQHREQQQFHTIKSKLRIASCFRLVRSLMNLFLWWPENVTLLISLVVVLSVGVHIASNPKHISSMRTMWPENMYFKVGHWFSNLSFLAWIESKWMVLVRDSNV